MAKKFNELRDSMTLASLERVQVNAEQMLAELARDEKREVQRLAQANNPILPNHT